MRMQRLFFALFFSTLCSLPVFSDNHVQDVLQSAQFGGTVVVVYHNALVHNTIVPTTESGLVEYSQTITISNSVAYNPKYVNLFAGIDRFTPVFIDADHPENSRIAVEFYRDRKKIFSFAVGRGGKTVYWGDRAIQDNLGFAQFAIDQLSYEEVQELKSSGNL